MNFDLVLQNIRELNILAGEGESFVQATARGAKLSKKDPVQLTLYRNGIVMFEGPFRSYQEHSTQVSSLQLDGKMKCSHVGASVHILFLLLFTAVHARSDGQVFSF